MLKSPISLKLIGTDLGLVGEWLWLEGKSKLFIPFKLGGPPARKNDHLKLICVYLIRYLWFSISTTRKAMKDEIHWLMVNNYQSQNTDIHLN